MTGMGGGSLMTPLLILVFGTAPVTAVGSDITYAAATKTVGGWRHLRLRTVNLGLSFWLAIGSVPAAIAGVWVIEWLHDRYGNDLDDIVLTMLAIALHRRRASSVLVRALFMSRAAIGERESFELTRRHKVAAVAIGASTGLRDRAHLGGERHADRGLPDRLLPDGPAQRGGDGRVPRGRPAGGGRGRPHRRPATSTSGWSGRSCWARSQGCGSAAI